jgi:hypothetical protein
VDDPREPIPEEWIDAALAADLEWMRISRSVVFVSPARDQVRMMLEAVLPLLRQAWLSAVAPGGELVRQTWVYWALEQPDVAEHPNWVKSWAELDERDREVDDRIYSAVAAKAVHDAGLAHERMQAQIFALGAHRPAVFEALRFAAASAEYGSQAKRYLAALKALGGDEEGGDRV